MQGDEKHNNNEEVALVLIAIWLDIATLVKLWEKGLEPQAQPVIRNTVQ